MGVMSRLEGGLDSAFDKAAGAVFRGPIEPAQIAKRAEKQMNREKLVGAGKQYAPTLYTVLVNKGDDKKLFAFYPTMAAEIETYLMGKGSQNGLKFDGRPLVRFIVDDKLKHGKFDVIAENVAAPIIAKLRDEEAEYYGIKTSAPNKPQAQRPSFEKVQPLRNDIVQPRVYADDPTDDPLAQALRALDHVPNAGAQSAVAPRMGVPNTGVPSAGVAGIGMPSMGALNVGVPNVGIPGAKTLSNAGVNTGIPGAPATALVRGATKIPGASIRANSANFNQGEHDFEHFSGQGGNQPAYPDPHGNQPAYPDPHGNKPAYQGQRVNLSSLPMVNAPHGVIGQARLNNLNAGRSYALTQHPIIIGRDASCDIPLDDANVSRRHAQLTQDATGTWKITDLGSTNGSRLNGRSMNMALLRDGDELSFGTTILEFREN